MQKEAKVAAPVRDSLIAYPALCRLSALGLSQALRLNSSEAPMRVLKVGGYLGKNESSSGTT